MQGLLNAEPGSPPGHPFSSRNSHQFALTPVTQAAEDDGDTKADGDDGRDQHDISGGRPWGRHTQVKPAAHTTPFIPESPHFPPGLHPWFSLSQAPFPALA